MSDGSRIEAQLAHTVRDSLGRAYNRTEFVEQRREMLQTWADYLDPLRNGKDTLPPKRRRAPTRHAWSRAVKDRARQQELSYPPKWVFRG